MSAPEQRSDLIKIRRDGDSALVILNRPEKRNALSIELREVLVETVTQLAPQVNAIGLTGAGSAFCAGMDITQFGGDLVHRRRLVESSVRCFEAIASCSKPTVAFVNGPAIAGGFALALVCDVRVARHEARFGFPEVGRHIPPSYAAAVWSLTPALARDLCLTGRIIGAQEALSVGVVSRISDGYEALAEIAEAPGSATAEVKRRILLHRQGMSPAGLAEEEARTLHEALLGA